MKGIYILLIKVFADSKIRIGALGNILFKKGLYAYVGSAMNGIEARVARHKRSEKRLHWHVDYLLASGNAKIVDVFVRESNKKDECGVARSIEKRAAGCVKGFGSSDCPRCKSHLFLVRSPRSRNSLILF